MVKLVPVFPQSGDVVVKVAVGLSLIFMVCIDVSEQVPSVIMKVTVFVPKEE